MSEPRYKVGNVVRIVKEPWCQFSGEIVVITAVFEAGDGNWMYEWVVPERSGAGAERFLGEVVIEAYR